MAQGASVLLAAVVSCALHSAAFAGFVGYVVTSADIEHEGRPLTVYTVSARFDGAQDTVLLAYRLRCGNAQHLKGFWHFDAASAPQEDAEPVLSQSAGSWSPALTHAPRKHRGLDSFLTIGGDCGPNNMTIADPAWSRPAPRSGAAAAPSADATATTTPASGGAGPDSGDPDFGDTRGWSRPDLPGNGVAGWYAVAPRGTSPGRVGASPNSTVGGTQALERPATDVRLAQFVLSRGHERRAFELTVAFSDGTEGMPQRYATGSFTLGAGAQPNAAPTGGAGGSDA
jgi:hypothetical protein